MSWLRGLAERFNALFRRSLVEQEMDEEFRFHLEMETEKLVREGLSPDAARREALIRFGGVERMRERTREERGTRLIEDTIRDLHYAARALAKNRVFAFVAVVTLALGIGANTAVFSVVNGVLLKPLPFNEPDRLVTLKEADEHGRSLWVSHPNFADWRERSRSFSGMLAVMLATPQPVLGAIEPAVVPAIGVSREFFTVLGVQPFLGRPILPEENQPGGPDIVMVSHRFWQTHLGSDPNLETVQLDIGGRPHAVVGVMPPGFVLFEEADVYYPLEQHPIEIRSAHNYHVIGRLRPGVTYPQARDEMAVLAAALKEQYGDATQAVGVNMGYLHSEIVGESRRAILVLLGAAMLVLLVACSNVASTLLARGATRQREFAIRAALGASRFRLTRQLLTESLLLAAGGAVIATALAGFLVRTLRQLGTGMVPRVGEVTVDPRVLAFTAALAVATAVLFGLFPALRLSNTRYDPLRWRSGTGQGTTRVLPWRVLLAVEAGLALLLLIGSGLLIRSLAQILDLEAGFQTEGVLTVEIQPPGSRYPDGEARTPLYERMLAELRSLPGVQQVGLANLLPLEAGTRTGPVLLPPISDPEDPDEWAAIAGWRVADAEYFEALRIRLLRGRLFDERDVDGTPGVAIVNEALANRLWPGEEPIGRPVRALWDFRNEELSVIGVVAEARRWSRQAGSQYEIYMHHRQRPEHTWAMRAVIHAAGDPAALIPAARERLRAVDPNVPVRLQTMEARLAGTVTDRRFTMAVLASFAAIALILAAVGIYGVVSYTVARSTSEIGLRVALGADPRRLRGLIQRQVMLPILVGTGAGIVAGLALTRLMQSLLYEVRPADPVTFSLVSALLLATAAAASYVPAHRATRVDPVMAMRTE
jgi:putative ABC transport system permease protein